MLDQIDCAVEPEFSATALEDSFRAEQEHAEQMRAELEMEFQKTTLDLDRDLALAYLNESLPAGSYIRLTHELASLIYGGRVKHEAEWRAAWMPQDSNGANDAICTGGFPTPAEAATELVRLWNERRAIKAA